MPRSKNKIKVAVLAVPGINRALATREAFELAGAKVDIVHTSELRGKKKNLREYKIFSIPGGFSYGDHIQSGRVMALEFQNPIISSQIYFHLKEGRFILGVCNGFQALVQSGLLPFGEIHSLFENEVSLTNNESGRFQSKWVQLAPVRSVCKFVDPGLNLNIPIDNGEGRFLIKDKKVLHELGKNGQIVYRYSDNPNGSVKSIAGICDPSGQILGMMPHAEDFVRREHHPNWRRMENNRIPDGLRFFENIVNNARLL